VICQNDLVGEQRNVSSNLTGLYFTSAKAVSISIKTCGVMATHFVKDHYVIITVNIF